MGLRVKRRNFIKDDEVFFYLGDTCWSAFTNIEMSDWHYYLQYRKRQGYNVLQINILPQWDASATGLDFKPFDLNQDGSYNFYKINDSYFGHAKEMCRIAKEYGFELALVVLWCNYVPKTWANNMLSDNTMPYECIDEYVKKAHSTFNEFEPLYVVSGDTDLNEEISQSYYLKASNILKQLAPNCLQTLHVRGRLMEIPLKLIDCIDFYMFQSGHNAQPENLSMTHRLPEYYIKNYPEKPLINSEPCYEQMGYSHRMYGRFHQFDIRRAAWQSILAGAYSGIAYGAAGIYSWHVYGTQFKKNLGEGFDSPNPWHLAIHYPGAWDYSDIKNILWEYNIKTLQPKQEILLNKTDEIRIATTNDEKIWLIYVPENTTIKLDYLFSDDDKVTIIDLQTRHKECGSVFYDNCVCCLGMHIFEHDALYVIERK